MRLVRSQECVGKAVPSEEEICMKWVPNRYQRENTLEVPSQIYNNDKSPCQPNRDMLATRKHVTIVACYYEHRLDSCPKLHVLIIKCWSSFQNSCHWECISCDSK